MGLHEMMNNYEIPKVSFLTQKFPDFWATWPGFHAGDNKWLKPNPLELSAQIVSDITWETKVTVIERELKKLGISIYNDVQILK
jgi:hypothetical protein